MTNLEKLLFPPLHYGSALQTYIISKVSQVIFRFKITHLFQQKVINLSVAQKTRETLNCI